MTVRAFLTVCLFTSAIIACGPAFAQTYNLGIQRQLEMYEQLYSRYGIRAEGRDAAAREGRDSFYSPDGCNSECIGCDENSLFHRTKYFGEKNDAEDAYLTEEEAVKYAAVGELSCIRGGKRTKATAFLGASADTFVTVAHTFKGVDEGSCVFRRYDRFGNFIPGQEYSVIDYWTRWQERADSSANHEFAIGRLDRGVTGVANGLIIKAGQTQVVDIEVVGFQSIVSRETRRALRKTTGKIHDKAGSGFEKFDNLIVNDATASRSTSGAPIIESATGIAIGMVVGMPEEAENLGTEFSVVNRNFHVGILFDKQFIREYKKFLGIE